jgi:hydrogenase maturation protein HypF
MPGGEQAVHEPWRMAVAHLRDADCDAFCLAPSVPAGALQTAEKMIERGFNAPLTSSVGRLFDAVAAIAGVRLCGSYEAQAAVELEWLATGMGADGVYPFEIRDANVENGNVAQPASIDTRPLIRAVAADARQGVEAKVIARRFHSTVVAVIAEVCRRIRRETGLNDVVLSGGVFMNALLTVDAMARLRLEGFRVFRHELTPPSDGSLSLGQVAVAARVIASA